MVKKYPTWEGKRIEMEMAEIMFFAMDMFFFVFRTFVLLFERFRTETFEKRNVSVRKRSNGPTWSFY